ncbi:MAG: hypothetical protein NZ653_00190 [Anaerolineae bacterium]|nr:hypothetical protein [Anaerolineae bacterium]
MHMRSQAPGDSIVRSNADAERLPPFVFNCFQILATGFLIGSAAASNDRNQALSFLAI